VSTAKADIGQTTAGTYILRRSRMGDKVGREVMPKKRRLRRRLMRALRPISLVLDTAASFHMAREEPDAIDKSRGGKQQWTSKWRH
jgi:hypothetical protein